MNSLPIVNRAFSIDSRHLMTISQVSSARRYSTTATAKITRWLRYLNRYRRRLWLRYMYNWRWNVDYRW